jgi:hypothetical protein
MVVGGLVAASSLAAAGVPGAHLRVTPSAGSAKTKFIVSFRTPQRTGRHGQIQLHDVLSASATRGTRSCVRALRVRAHDARAGARVRVVLDPRRLGGQWCAGGYDGKISELQTPVCVRGRLCRAHVRVRARVARFALRVRSAPPPPGSDTRPPNFAGIERAFACTPGPQRPGQTTPYTLSWQAASDEVTPTAQIVYDVFLGSNPGGEDYASPTWTTPPGATSFRTPGLPSHGSFFFVVRARDLAGNQDRNKREQRGLDPCV